MTLNSAHEKKILDHMSSSFLGNKRKISPILSKQMKYESVAYCVFRGWKKIDSSFLAEQIEIRKQFC